MEMKGCKKYIARMIGFTIAMLVNVAGSEQVSYSFPYGIALGPQTSVSLHEFKVDITKDVQRMNAVAIQRINMVTVEEAQRAQSSFSETVYSSGQPGGIWLQEKKLMHDLKHVKELRQHLRLDENHALLNYMSQIVIGKAEIVCEKKTSNERIVQHTPAVMVTLEVV